MNEVFFHSVGGKHIVDNSGNFRANSIYLAFESVGRWMTLEEMQHGPNNSARDEVNKRKGTLKSTGVGKYEVIWDTAESPDETVQQTVHKSESDIPGYDENVDGDKAFDIIKDMVR